MSAYVVDPKTISMIVKSLEVAVQSEGQYPATFPDLRYLDTQTLRDAVMDNPAELGRTMYAMNINAVEQRYPDGNLPGTYTNNEQLDAYKYNLPASAQLRPVQVYKSLKCYLYQCTEGDVSGLPLYKALSEYCSTLAEHIVESSKEYDKTSWG